MFLKLIGLSFSTPKSSKYRFRLDGSSIFKGFEKTRFCQFGTFLLTRNFIKSIPKPPQNDEKTNLKTIVFLMFILFRFLIDFGSFWAPKWTPLGSSWAPLGRILGRSWASLGWSGTPPGCILAPGVTLGLDFKGLGTSQGGFWRPSGACFGSLLLRLALHSLLMLLLPQ